ERQRRAGLNPPCPRLRIGAQRRAGGQLGRRPEAHTIERRHQGLVLVAGGERQRATVLIARGGKIIAALERAAVVALVHERGVVLDEAAANRDLFVDVAAALQRPRQ